MAVVGSPSTTTTTAPPRVEISVVVTDSDGVSLPGAEVRIAGVAATTVDVLAEDLPITVEVARSGYAPTARDVLAPGTVTVALDPVRLHGRVVGESGVPLADARVSLGDETAVSGSDGTFEIAPAVPGVLTVQRPGWLPATVDWSGGDVEVTIRPRIVKALHAVMWLPGQDAWESFLGLADRTEINAVVLDVKDESGLVAHTSQVPLANDVDAVVGRYELASVVRELHSRGLYVIGRVVSFEDPVMASARPDLAIRRGDRAYRKGSQAFLDPTDADARGYALDLAVEACEAGMDEVQFDYVRFPTGMTPAMHLDGAGVYVGAEGQGPRLAAIATFLSAARDALHERGCAVSADIFAIVLSTKNDQGIGQRPEELSAVVDALSPMIYPDHYSNGWIGFADPADHPFAVVDNAMAAGTPLIAPTAIMRPWIADFNYGPASVRAEIDAVEKYGSGWMLWNPGSRHTEGALNEAETPPTAPSG